MAELNGRPIGFIQIIDPQLEELHYRGDLAPNLKAIDTWIGESDDIGQGYGTRMMQLAIERCFKTKGVSAILVDPLESNTRAQKFYRRLGFQFMERRIFGQDDCFVYRLKREDWNRSEP